MKLGISSHSFGWAAGAVTYEIKNKMTAYDLLDIAYKYGIKVVQIADNIPLHLLSEDMLQVLKILAKEKNIEIELGLKGLTRDSLNKYIQLCEFLDCKLLRVVTDSIGYEPTLKEIISILMEVEPIIASKNIIIAIENHDRLKCKELSYIIERVNSSYIGICLDTANSIIASEGVEYVQTILNPYILNVHSKDYKIKRLPCLMGFTVEGCPAGDGDVDIPKILKSITSNVNVILEMWTTPEDSVEKTIRKERAWVEKSINYLREFIPL